MEQLEICTSVKNYPVFIGSHILFDADSLLKRQLSNTTKVLIVTDDHIAPLYLEDLNKTLSKIVDVISYIVPSGEAYKSFDQYHSILTFALENGLDRKSAIFALGGGVIGDLAGFVAATFMRGIKFFQVPTTLLAHDSSVGGKVGINHPLGKNMIGSFYQPEAVLYDVSLLKSLTQREWVSGFAEVIKHGFISGERLYQWLKSEITVLPINNEDVLIELLKEAITVKADIVQADEREAGIRAYLNFGHTLGHAIEATYGYGNITHGEGVAIGMLFALKLSNEVLEANFPIDEIKNWFQQLSFPITIPESCGIDDLLTYMKRDKKSENGAINMVLLKRLGEPIKQVINEEQLKKALLDF